MTGSGSGTGSGSCSGCATAGAASRSVSASARRSTPSLCPPLRLALLGERPDALVEVVRAEARLAQLDQFALRLRVQRALGLQQLADHALVAALGGRRQRGDLGRVGHGPLLEPGAR